VKGEEKEKGGGSDVLYNYHQHGLWIKSEL